MREAGIWARLLGVEGAVVEDVVVDQAANELVVHVRPRAAERGRCSQCKRRCPGFDRGGGRRRWRVHDVGLVKTYLEADAPRVDCPEHGVVVSAVPWARGTSRFTQAFEDTVAWLVAHADRTTVSALLRITWRAVGTIIERVVAEARERVDPFKGVCRIGIDEVSYRTGHRYLTVVVDHVSGRLLFATPGKDEAAANAFFDALGEEGCRRIEVVSADASPAFAEAVRKRCPNAVMCMDPFHVVKWATDAVDQVRRSVWNEARRHGLDDEAEAIKGTRYALLKNPEDLTSSQHQALAMVERVNRPLFRAYLLKEQLREVFKLKDRGGVTLLLGWLRWAHRSRLEPFRKAARSIASNLSNIAAALRLRVSNALTESMNNKLRLITRQAYGFHSHQPLIALAMLKLGGFCPSLPHA